MTYKVEFEEEAIDNLNKLDNSVIVRIKKSIDKLKTFDRIPESLKLKNYPNMEKYGKQLYRTRAGDYRIIFFVDEEIKTIKIIKIGHRREIYDD